MLAFIFVNYLYCSHTHGLYPGAAECPTNAAGGADLKGCMMRLETEDAQHKCVQRSQTGVLTADSSGASSIIGNKKIPQRPAVKG